MAGAYEPEEDESSIDLVPQEKKTVSINSNIPKLLNLFSRPATTDTQLKEDTQPKRKGKVLGFERHTIDLKMHPYHRSLRLPTTYQVTSFHELRDVINNDNEGPHWLKFLSQAIAYDNATHEKASNEVATYKTLARKCKRKVKSSEQRLVDSEECVIAKEIDNETLQTKLKEVQTQLAN
ncbi:hypothetical protein MMC22_007275, partial [Lobaria immixta]|nr:hypothetical protein [Lobaria immixta]